MSNAAATCTWVAALIRINDTAANRRPAVSPASQAKDRFPCTNTRPPCWSSIIAAAAPISVAPVGISGKGGWVVTTVIVPPPNPPGRITERTPTPCQESWTWVKEAWAIIVDATALARLTISGKHKGWRVSAA